ISILLVDTSLPGFKATPIRTFSGLQTTATYYEDVRVPAEMLVGDENSGWSLITNQLNHERVALATTGWVRLIWEQVVEWARGTGSLSEQWVQLLLARCDARIEVLKLFNWHVAAELEADALSPADASAMKVYGTE